MKKIYYCVFCEKQFIEDKNYHLASIDDKYVTRNTDPTSDNYDCAEYVEYHGICLDCEEQADKDYWSNYNYHHGLLI